ncbi:aldehyde dehydrogenase family protein [[Mycobacterium] vasticus]|uniref:Aldehyde dehydrogenase family protein n=1 Tax=[Mycobacterium] vasticus TaxID=2875777 RepID=A0ABU5YZR6_9MYCO|nr:aldehyde dehydrogenase family protein [Mycolicibacter sp. MYC017]MEB3070643.1 aldehyde dehydrogenase family protein [Mycolicibacter sp. MYC017]
MQRTLPECLPTPRLIIGAEELTSGSGGSHEHRNPATGEVQAVVPMAGAAEVDAAVTAARAAFPGWRDLDLNRRRDILLEIARRIVADQERLAAIATHEMGIPNLLAGPTAQMAADWFTYYAGWIGKAGGDVIPVAAGDALDYVRYEPVGVIGAIIPWNGPLVAIGMKIAPALAAGNCVVLKPPEHASFTALRFAELAAEAGLPPGVFNVIPGDGQAGAPLCGHPGIDKITFTGSAESARKVLTTAAQAITPVILELGGKSANIVFPDGDLDAAVTMAVGAGLVTLSGQGCMLPTRLLVHNDIYDEVVARVTGAAQQLTVGDPWEPTTVMGPLATAAQLERVSTVVSKAVADGSGKLLGGGERPAGLSGGYYYSPTVFGDVDPASHLAQKEIFGPVLSILRFNSEDEAVQLANNTEYGLAAYVHTRDLRRAHVLSAALDAGGVAVNGFPIVPSAAPFGGIKQSGFGREGGIWGLREFQRTKNVYIGLS